MADAKIITYGEAMGAGANVIADNLSPSLLVESVDDKDYILIDTTDSAEKLILAGGGATVKIENASPSLVLDNTTPEDTNDGRESTISFTGVRLGGGAHTLGHIQCSHHGTGDDDSGKFTLELNNAGTPGNVLTIYRDGEMRLGGRLAALAGSYDNPSIKWDGDGNTGMYRPGTDIWAWSTNGSETMRLDGRGNLGIAMTPGGSHKIDVTGSAGLSTGTAWTNTSDSRVKTNIVTIENALDKINQLRPVSFQYTDEYLSVHTEIDSSKTYNSFIAQEYEDVFPDAVTIQGDLKRKTADAVPEDLGNGTSAVPAQYETLLENVKQFTPHDLTMYLVRAVQELSARIEELENG